MHFTGGVFFIGVLAFGVHVLHADITLVQEIESFDGANMGQKEQYTLQISGKRLRIDIGQMMSSIVLGEKKTTYSISHEARQYTILSHPAAEKTGLLPQRETLSKSGEKPALESTGKKERISGYPCRQVLSRDRAAGSVTEIWLTEEAMDLKAFVKEFEGFGEISMSQMLGELEKYPELRGVPIRVIQYDRDKMRVRSTVRRLDSGKIPDSVFEIPAGYAEIKLPNLKEGGD